MLLGYESSFFDKFEFLKFIFAFFKGLPASYHASKGSYNIRWPNVFSPSPYGSTIYLISAGSSVGSSDILSPVSTMADQIDLEWTNDRNQHEIYVNILAFAANGEFSRYGTKFLVG